MAVTGDGAVVGYVNIKERINFSPQFLKVTLLTQTLTVLVFTNDGSDTTSVVLSWEW